LSPGDRGAHRVSTHAKRLITAVVVTLLTVATSSAEDIGSKVPSDLRSLVLRDQRTALMNCFAASVDEFDDRLSPANVVADAVAWHCEADRLMDNYWTVLSSRRWSPDTLDIFHRDLALPFVLKRRAQRLKRQTAAAGE
jgi:hypothetical protein